MGEYAEEERKRLVQAEIDRKEALRQAAIEKEKRDGRAQAQRFEELTESCETINALKKLYLEQEKRDMEQHEVKTFFKAQNVSRTGKNGLLRLGYAPPLMLFYRDFFFNSQNVRRCKKNTWDIFSDFFHTYLWAIQSCPLL